MKIENLRELIDSIYEDIKKRNSDANIYAIPNSDDFYNKLIKKYNLIPFTLPKLMKLMATSHIIFTFDLVEKDVKKKIKGIEGYVISDLATIILLKDYFENKFAEEFSVQFNKKIDPMKALKEFIPKIKDFNNTEVGKFANVIINLIHFESLLKKDPHEYSKKTKAEKLDKIIEESEDISFFVNENDNSSQKGAKPKKAPVKTATQGTNEHKSRTLDSQNYSDFISFSNSQPVKKTLSVYGIEFYTRVCFRDYQFHLIKQLIDEKLITKKNDFQTIKKLLKKVRTNSDQDLKLQEFANEINTLERIVNAKIKEFDG